MPVRTKQLYFGTPPYPVGTAYTVPGGFRSIVKTVEAYHYGTVSTSLEIEIKKVTTGETISLVHIPGTTVDRLIVRWSGWAVMEAGDRIRVESYPATYNFHVLISGTELPL